MPGRKYSSSSLYRYGFNEKENDNEVKGEGNQQDYGMRIYDPRLVRFLSVDPISSEFPWNSPFSFAENDPINFIDLDGLERSAPPRSVGGRNAGRAISHWRYQAEGVVRSYQNWRQRTQREEAIRHVRNMNTNPQYRAKQNFVNNLVQNQQRDSYWRNAFNSAGIVLTGGGVQDNKKIGDTWDNFVHESMLKNPNYVGVARQVSLKITGMINGKMTEAKIRIDNVGIKTDAVTGKVLFDFKESKYSIEQITISNVVQTLTPQQKQVANILINGSNVQFFIRGNGSTEAMNSAIHGFGQKLINGQNITGQVGEINIIVPSQSQQTNTSGTVNTNSANSKPQSSQTSSSNGSQPQRE